MRIRHDNVVNIRAFYRVVVLRAEVTVILFSENCCELLEFGGCNSVPKHMCMNIQ